MAFISSTTETAGGSHSGTQTRRNRKEGTSADAADVLTKDADQNREEVCAPIRRIFSAKEIARVGTWNVRTLYQCGSMAQVLKEMNIYSLQVLGISEMRWTGQGQFCSDGITILYSGRETQHTHGVGILLNKEAASALVAWKPVNHRIITARLQTRHAKVSIVQIYAPTDTADEEEKEEFYGQLQDTLDEIPTYDVKLLIGDFNAQISSDQRGLNSVVGPWGTARETSDNGDRMSTFCSNNGLKIGNTFFKHKDIHKKTWLSPDGNSVNEIDYICVNKKWGTSLMDVKRFGSS